MLKFLKTNYHKIIICAVLFFAVVLQGNGADKDRLIEIEVYVSPSIIHIGDIINYNFVIKHDPSVKVDFPDLGKVLDKFSIKDFSQLETFKEKNKIVLRENFKLNTFLTGDYVIPPIEVKYKKGEEEKTAVSGALYVRVDSLLNSEEKDIRDITPPWTSKIKSKIFIWVIWIAVPLLFIAFVIYLVYYFRKRAIEKEEAAPLPWVEALEMLEHLKNTNLINENIKEYYYELSYLLRFYIEKRFGVMAPERTTEEFIKIMQNKSIFNANHQRILQKFLKESDLVKFAKNIPPPQEIDKGTKLVEDFVKDTIPKEETEGDKKE